MAALACNITGGLAQLWLYNNIAVGMPIAPALGRVPEVPAVPLMVDGVEFRLSLLSTTPALASQITFVAAQNMNGRMVECRTSIRDNGGATITVPETITLRVGSGSK
jgi:hypothetical protein